MAVDDSSFQGAEVVDVINQVKHAYATVAKEGNADLVPLKSVALSLTAVTTFNIEAGVEFKVPIIEWEVSIGHSVSEEYTHKIDITLEPPDVAAEISLGREMLSSQLVSALRTIRNVASAAPRGDVPLELSDGSVELKFVVTRESKAEVLVVSGSKKDVTTHVLKVTVGEPAE